MPARKLEPATLDYLISLKSKEQVAVETLAHWKKRLYDVMAESAAKIGTFEFEEARKNCFTQTQELKKIEKERIRVEKALKDAG